MSISPSARHLETLISLGVKGEMFGEVSVSTIALGKELGLSQQTVSRDLIRMENEGLITRSVSKNGLAITITEEGYRSMRSICVMIDSILSRSALEMDGIVSSGLGEGGYYVGLKGYHEQFRSALGYTPFPGTLNLMADPVLQKRFLWDMDATAIEGFSHSGRTFGRIDLYPVRLIIHGNKIRSAIIVPHRTAHPKGTCEIIAKDNLRKKYGLEDGSVLIISKKA